MADEVLKATVVLEDQYSSGAEKIAKSNAKMKQSTESAASSFSKIDTQTSEASRGLSKFESALSRAKSSLTIFTNAAKRKIDFYINTSSVDKKISTLEKELERMSGRKVSISATAKVSNREIKNAQKEAKALKRELEAMTGKKYNVNVDLGGNAKSGIASLLGGITGGGLSGVVSGGLLAAGTAATAGVSKIASLGSAREQNMVAMTHFMGGDSSGARDMLNWASDNARTTQYSEAEVQGATRRAIQISEGDTGMAKKLTTLAEDMASLTPGKTISDAMEALADAQMGEMERMKEFGFKSNSDLFEEAGGDLFKLKSTNGRTIEDIFKGGTKEGGDTASAKIGTVLGTFESALADTGEKLISYVSPALDTLVQASEPAAAFLSSALEGVGGTVSNLITALQPFAPVVSAFASLLGSVFMNAVSVAGTVINSLLIPAIQWVGTHMQPVFNALIGVINKVKSAFTSVTSAVKSAVSALGQIPSKIASLASSAVSSLASSVKSLFSSKHATGTTAFSGGFTQMNENTQGEIVQLPSGAKIYPYQTTKKLINKALAGSGLKGGKSSHNVFNINIDARGSNMSKSQVHKLKKEIVNDIVEALDNTVPT